MRALAFVLLAQLGCGGDDHHGPADAKPIDAGPFDRCGSIAYDANRYHVISPTTMMMWSTGVGACYALGMELASINDADEYAAIPSDGLPYWLSTKYDDEGLESLDGCTPPYFVWAAGEPASMELETCVYRGSDGMHTMPCETPTIAMGGLCETPRPNQMCAQMSSTYTASDDHTKPDAASACAAMGAHLVEINSSDELQVVLAKEPSVTTFWVAATFNGTVFMDSTSCPEVFQWAPGEPMQASGNRCVTYTRSSGMQMRACTDTASTICEKN